jgi:hypothetical protein
LELGTASLHVKARFERQAVLLARLHNRSGDATNEHATFGIAALSADHYPGEFCSMNGAGGVVLKALWSFLLCFFDVAFYWQRVRLLTCSSPLR